MPYSRVLRRPSLAGSLSVALALVAVLVLLPTAAHAQRGPAPRDGYGAGYTDVFGELAVQGQTQVCREHPLAEVYFTGEGAQTYAVRSWSAPWTWPLYSGYSTPPFGGAWNPYTGVGNICLWRVP